MKGHFITTLKKSLLGERLPRPLRVAHAAGQSGHSARVRPGLADFVALTLSAPKCRAHSQSRGPPHYCYANQLISSAVMAPGSLATPVSERFLRSQHSYNQQLRDFGARGSFVVRIHGGEPVIRPAGLAKALTSGGLCLRLLLVHILQIRVPVQPLFIKLQQLPGFLVPQPPFAQCRFHVAAQAADQCVC